MGDKTTEEVLDIKAQEESFNEQLLLLRKAIEESKDDEDSKETDDATQDLIKAKAAKAKKEADEAEDEEEAEEDEKDEDEEKIGKSIEDQLAEDPEAEASMDVEPFLRQLVKAIDNRIDEMQKSVRTKLDSIEVLAKAQAGTLLAQADLQKAQANTVDRIAKQDQKVGGIRRLNKARFEVVGGEPVEMDGPTVLMKSMSWVQEKKIDLLEAGMIETRVNKGILGRQNDALDHKVMKLLKEAS